MYSCKNACQALLLLFGIGKKYVSLSGLLNHPISRGTIASIVVQRTLKLGIEFTSMSSLTVRFNTRLLISVTWRTNMVRA